tara:strand:- start:1270 stop:1575 length:306 start_codon:yes stop_codon:yes gene_type:complete
MEEKVWFDGIIYNVDYEEQKFAVSLVDKSDEDSEPLWAVFSFKDVNPQDRDYIRLGNSFDWHFVPEEEFVFNKEKSIKLSSLNKKSKLADEIFDKIAKGNK